jgi:hypothetical protein
MSQRPRSSPQQGPVRTKLSYVGSGSKRMNQGSLREGAPATKGIANAASVKRFGRQICSPKNISSPPPSTVQSCKMSFHTFPRFTRSGRYREISAWTVFSNFQVSYSGCCTRIPLAFRAVVVSRFTCKTASFGVEPKEVEPLTSGVQSQVRRFTEVRRRSQTGLTKPFPA